VTPPSFIAASRTQWVSDMKTWSELFPNGRDIFYEGNDPEGFVTEIKAKFGFDPSKSKPQGVWASFGWNKADGYCFFCPPEHLNAIYGGEYPMGS
jgi:hypothetical protein